MRWVAPTEKDEANHALEKRLWAAADQFRDIAERNPKLAGVLPGNYQVLQHYPPQGVAEIFGVEKTDETGRVARLNRGLSV